MNRPTHKAIYRRKSLELAYLRWEPAYRGFHFVRFSAVIGLNLGYPRERQHPAIAFDFEKTWCVELVGDTARGIIWPLRIRVRWRGRRYSGGEMLIKCTY